MRYKIELAYNGARYHGWQIQPNAITVQEVLNKCLSTMLKQTVETLGCGRTDTGVHASHFVAHFDLESADGQITTPAFQQKLNKFLPPDIVVFSIVEAADGFNARFDAKSRTYKYLIHTRKDPFIGDSSWYFPYKLDLGLMNQGARILMEYSDFASFCKAGADNGTTICKLMECNFVQEGHRITFTIKADRFLRNMVRAVTGTLTDLGTGKITLKDLRRIMEARNRSSAGQSVPAHGLSLVYVEY